MIPVSCTEHGRWSYTSTEFTDSEHVLSSKLRRVSKPAVHASLRRDGSYHADQGAVWDGITELQERTQTSSPTHAMRDVYRARGQDLDAYIAACPMLTDQVGLVVFINDRVVGFDAVSRPAAYALLHTKLLKSYALDAMLDRQPITQASSVRLAQDFLEEASNCPGEAFPSVGHGEDLRYLGPQLAGSALVWDTAVIHTAFFRLDQTTEAPGRMSSARQRRGFRS